MEESRYSLTMSLKINELKERSLSLLCLLLKELDDGADLFYYPEE